jgi:methyl-accepting chemotaxis protein
MRLTPGVAVAAAAGAAGLFASCGALLAWRVQPALLGPVLFLSPAMMAAASWLAARNALRAALRPAGGMAARLAAQDRTLRAHAAVAKLAGAGVARLAQGDFSARIAIDLPAPYDTFRAEFNAAMARLEDSAEALAALRRAVDERAAALGEAAARLEKRARKLDARIEADLRIVDVLRRRDGEEALAIARTTLTGAGVAARRNIEAAAELARLGEALSASLPALPDKAGAGKADADEAAPAGTRAA